MKRIALVAVIIMLFCSAYPGDTSKYVIRMDIKERPVGIFKSNATVYLVTNLNIRYGKTKNCKKTGLEKEAKCAYLLGNNLYVGTAKGIIVFDIKLHKYQSTPALDKLNSPVIAITADAAGNLIMATAQGNIYRYSGNELNEIYKTVYINCLNASPDSSVWIGTNTGLYRLKNNSISHYVEEGVANFEIPDNIVENLVLDESDHLWIIMSEATGIIKFVNASQSEFEHGHLPSLSYIGTRNNHLNNVLYLKDKGYLLSTQQALYFLPSQRPVEEVFETHNSNDKIETARVLVDISRYLNGNSPPKMMIKLSRNKIALVNNQGLYLISPKKELRNM